MCQVDHFNGCVIFDSKIYHCTCLYENDSEKRQFVFFHINIKVIYFTSKITLVDLIFPENIVFIILLILNHILLIIILLLLYTIVSYYNHLTVEQCKYIIG